MCVHVYKCAVRATLNTQHLMSLKMCNALLISFVTLIIDIVLFGPEFVAYFVHIFCGCWPHIKTAHFEIPDTHRPHQSLSYSTRTAQ